jgi:hypothetical protein
MYRPSLFNFIFFDLIELDLYILILRVLTNENTSIHGKYKFLRKTFMYAVIVTLEKKNINI